MEHVRIGDDAADMVLQRASTWNWNWNWDWSPFKTQYEGASAAGLTGSHTLTSQDVQRECQMLETGVEWGDALSRLTHNSINMIRGMDWNCTGERLQPNLLVHSGCQDLGIESKSRTLR